MTFRLVLRITANVHVFCVQLLWCEAFCTWVSDGECCSDTVGGTEVNCVSVCLWGDVLSFVQIQWVVLR